jgi:hypothetical protein
MAMVHKLTVVIQMTGHGEDPVYYFTLKVPKREIFDRSDFPHF